MMTLILSLSLTLLFPAVNDSPSKSSSTPAQRTHHQASSKANSKDQRSKATQLEIARQEYEKGFKFFKAKEYERALTRFLRVYRVYQNPNLVYNMARSFEELKQYKDSADYYEEYLKLNPKAKDRQQVLLTIKTLRALPSSKSSSSPSHNQITTPPPPSPSPWWRSKSVWGWTGIGIGALSVIGGVYYGLEAMEQTDRLNRFQSGTVMGWSHLRDTRDESALYADLFYVGGAILLGAGGYLIYVSSPLSVQKDVKTKTSTSVFHWKINPLGASVSLSF